VTFFRSARKSKIGSKISIFCRLDFFIFFPLYFQKKLKIPVSDPENQSFLEEKLFVTKKTEIRVNKVTILVKTKQEKKMLSKKIFYCQLGFSSKIEVPKLGLARLGTFIAQLGSSLKIPARTHHLD
jgi:hypothetical protein